MSNITLEQVDLVMQRANVSYAEAKEALEYSNGDVVDALLYLERADRIHTTKKETASNQDKVVSFIDSLNATTFIMRKKERTFIDVPLSVALIFIILSIHISIFGLIAALIFGIKIEIKGENEIARKINSTIDDITK